jgi:hypothetical protein
MKRFGLAVFALALLLGTTGGAGQTRSAGDTPAFRFERPVDTAGSGPRRLVVDVPLLSGTRRDLADLRLFGSAGEEIPYLLLRPDERAPVWTPGGILAIPTTEKESGFEADLHETATVDAIRVGGLPVPLLKRLSLEGSGDREHWTVLLAEATLFDLPVENLQQLELAFVPGDYRYLRVIWNDANSGRVPAPLSVLARRVAPFTARRAPLAATLAVEQRSSEPGTSRYRLRLPAAGLPLVALRLVVENERVLREAVVTEPRLSGSGVMPYQLGRATLKRIVRDDATAEALSIPIAEPIGPQIDLAVDDGNNPPLRLTSVEAVFDRQPDVYFEATGAPVVARYGDPRLAAPRYDLAAARETIHSESVPDAKWGEARGLTREEVAPAATAASTRGAPIDAERFRVLRDIPAGQAGLVSLEIDPPALAHSAGPAKGFSDVRVLDQERRQVPYLVEQCVTPLVIDLPLVKQPSGTVAGSAIAVSEYRLSLPYAGLPASRLTLMTSARVFARRVTLGRPHPADRRHRDAWFETVGAYDWTHQDNASAAAPLILALPAVEDTDFYLRVEEGDNAPLPLTSAKLMLPGYRLRFYRGANEKLQLAYDRADLGAPRYDIQLLASDVLGQMATDIRASAEPDIPRAAALPLVSPRVFWIVLGTAVVVLLGMAVRLVRRA